MPRKPPKLLVHVRPQVSSKFPCPPAEFHEVVAPGSGTQAMEKRLHAELGSLFGGEARPVVEALRCLDLSRTERLPPFRVPTLELRRVDHPGKSVTAGSHTGSPDAPPLRRIGHVLLQDERVQRLDSPFWKLPGSADHREIATAGELRIYLTGRLVIEGDGGFIDQRLVPGRQGRRAFAYLVCERGGPVSREELAEAIWGHGTPPSWEISLRTLVSRLRRLLDHTGRAGNEALQSSFGCYQLRLPEPTWVDVEAAVEAQHECDTRLRQGDVAGSFGLQGIAGSIARRPFLPGEEGEWIDRVRSRLRDVLLRSLDAGAEIHLRIGEPEVAVQLAEETLALGPFRETAYRLLMRAHTAMGNPAQALGSYERCRTVLADALGADPSAETKALHLEILNAGAGIRP